jgi:DNA repair photolyase
MYIETKAKTALHYHERTFATNWDLNVYRGCEHKCVYCFARYTHRYLESDNFFEHIHVKTNIAELLDAELRKNRCGWEEITLGGVTDCYQPAEERYGLMTKIIEVLVKRRHPVSISTKSILILRDIDLLKKLAEVADVEVAASITTLDEDLRKKLEPGAAPARARMEMLARVKEAGCSASILAMPVIPFLTDTTENLDTLYSEAAKHGVDTIYTSALHLRGCVKGPFLGFVRRNYPNLVEKYVEMYKGSYAPIPYRRKLDALSAGLKRKYRIYRRQKQGHRKGNLELFE